MANCRRPLAVVGFARRPKDGRGIPEGTGRGDAEIFAPDRARRNLERLRPIRFLSSERVPRRLGLQEPGGAPRQDRPGTRHRREPAFLSRGRARPVRADPEKPEGGRLEQDAGRELGAGHCRETVRDRSRLGARAERDRAQGLFRETRLTGSIISSGKRPRKTFSSSGSRTRSSSRSGMAATSITSRSPPRKRSGWKDAPVTTRARARCATWCRTICSSCFVSSRWSRRPISARTAFAMRR